MNNNYSEKELRSPLSLAFFWLLVLVILVFSFSCKNIAKQESVTILPDTNSTEYATRFSWKKYEQFTLVEVARPWQYALSSSFRYVLGEDVLSVPDSLEPYTFIQLPLHRVILMSTTYIPMLDTLGVTESILGVSGAPFVFNERLKDRIERGEVYDVGFDQQLNYELLLQLDPDAVFLYGVQAGVVQTKEKLEDLGIPVILCADYLEPYPLGRSEWIRFFSLFFGKEELAHQIFNRIADEYNSLKSLAAATTDKPLVMSGLPWKDTWYVAGGKSYAARLIEDAGGRYIWNDLDTEEARAVDIESVFYKTLNCNIWINAGVAGSLSDILSHDERFGKIGPFRDDMVFNNNKRMSEGGGNDYWESGALFPNLILKDLQVIFSRQESQYPDMYYYRWLR